MVEPEEYSYEEFPESSTVTRGMNVIEFEDDIDSVVCKRYVNYVERDGKFVSFIFAFLCVVCVCDAAGFLYSDACV